MKIKLEKFIALLIILFLGFIYQHNYINEFPSHIHAWAQSDQYALSLGFVDNGLNFFKPQTYVLNPQFPYKWTVPSKSGITAVDFPIHEYIPALLMKLTGNTSPFLFRLYTLLYGMLGLFFLFQLAFALTNDFFKSVLILVFAATSPVYVYYESGFLPTIPSLSNTVIGLYFYYLHVKSDQNRKFVLTILFLTLAALARTTYAIPLIAVLGLEFIRIVKKETKVIPKIVPVSISVLLLIIDQLYNAYLRGKYGSIILNHPLPPTSVKQVKEILKYVYHNWGLQYFTKLHYLIFFIVIIVAAIFFVRKKVSLIKSQKYFGLFAIIYLVGCFLFSSLMLRQFPAHDYYFLDTFFLPLILFFALLLSGLPSLTKTYGKISGIILLSLISICLVIQPLKSQKTRRETGFWDQTEATINNYKGSSRFLDSLGISKDSKILVIGAVAPNIPFIRMRRKGFAVMSTSRKNIENALKWDYNYIVFQDEFFITDVYTPFPEILSKLNKIADNGKITICTLSAKSKQQSLIDFLGLSSKTPVFQRTITFDTVPDSLWQNTTPSHDIAFSGCCSGHLTPGMPYGITYKSKNLPVLTTSPRKLLFSAYFLSDTAVNSELVASINTDGHNIYYRTYDLNEVIKKRNTWKKVSLIYQLPKVQSHNYEFALFVWNTGKSDMYYDNVSFSIY